MDKPYECITSFQNGIEVGDRTQLVRCKDCKHLIDHYGFMDDGYCKKMREDYYVKFKPKMDFYCADGVKKG